MTTKRKPQYKLINIGNKSESKQTRMQKILQQIPKGKAIVLTDKDLNLPQNKIVVKLIDPEDIPPITRKRRMKLPKQLKRGKK